MTCRLQDSIISPHSTLSSFSLRLIVISDIFAYQFIISYCQGVSGNIFYCVTSIIAIGNAIKIEVDSTVIWLEEGALRG